MAQQQNTNGRRFIYEQQWTDADRVSDADLSMLYFTKPTEIEPMMTFLYGRENAFMNPISFMTAQAQKGLDGKEYEYKVMSTMERTYALAESVSTTNPGIAGTSFEMVFAGPTKPFPRGYTIISPNQYQLEIQGEPRMQGSNWVYTMKYVSGANESAYVPLSELQAGTFFIKGWYAAAEWDSEGSTSSLVGTAMIRGNISLLRKSMEYKGSVANREVSVDLPTPNGTTKMFWDWQQWQLDLDWSKEVEDHYMYGVTNRKPDGTFPIDTKTGAPKIKGDMLLAQIGVKDTFGYNLSASKLSQAIRDTYSNMKDSSRREIILLTGWGGAEDFDKAIKSGILGSGFSLVSSDVFIGKGEDSGSGHANLRAQGYFATYDHIDGYTIRVKLSDFFDFGRIAKVKPIHPRSGLSIESHRMVFIDNSNYEGAPNLLGLYDKAEPFSRTPVVGIGNPPPSFPKGVASSSIHAHAIHYMKSCGVLLRRWNTSLDFQCSL